MSDVIKIGLLWHSLSSGNLGVRALTISQLDMLDKIAQRNNYKVDITIIGNIKHTSFAITEYESSNVSIRPEYIAINASSWRSGIKRMPEMFLAFRKFDMVIDIGEGDSFTDIYGHARYFRQIYSRFIAVISGRPLILGPQTIGPFSTGRRERIAGWIIRHASKIYVRDELSLALVNRLARDRNAFCSTDLAMGLPYVSSAAPSGGKPRVGINVSGLLYDVAEARFDLKIDYKDLIHQLIERIEPHAEIVIVNHVTAGPGHADNDEIAAVKLKARYPAIEVAPKFSDPRDAKEYISGLDFFTGARMHACIGAFSSGVPHISMAYSRKATGLFRSLGYDHVLDLTEQNNINLAVQMITDGFERRAELGSETQSALKLAKDKLRVFETDLEALMEQIR
jgi:polysaccharide pyruvyl transferase WcaK-like protein